MQFHDVSRMGAVANDNGVIRDTTLLHQLIDLPRPSIQVLPLAAQYSAVLNAARGIGTWAELFAVLAHETGHRAGSIRQLRWSDVDFAGTRIHWRGEMDKIGNDHFTPATSEAVELLTRERQSRKEIGDAYIFPARRGDRTQPMSGDAVFNLWKRIAAKAELPSGQRFGWHSLRRKFATELRHTNLRDLCDLGGWKSIQTLLSCYVRPDEDSQRTALEERTRPRIQAAK